ncbi:MAG TPA: hypothetical protein VKE74_08110 [Gemmataceae bacterium]|nr:hypothetical protein [Gemmataceae bacterium]
MRPFLFTLAGLTLVALVRLPAGPATPADDKDAIKKLLEYPVLTPRTTVGELQEFLDPRIPELPEPKTADDWAKETERLRAAVLEKVVFRGEAAKWKDAKVKVEEAGAIPGEGYQIKKLRYEIISGFWAPALLYVPDKLAPKAPVMLAVNGHDRAGKAVGYKQTRCINLAKRGVIVLNVEWLGMGQLAVPGDQHGAMNQLDLCGTSGLSLFYLGMSRGLDILLAQPRADPKRVAVSGLSGGGWQTIFISALDARVTLANPVAGYSGFRTRIRHFKDLGDSEQTPTDLATVADYTTLTAMRAPRPTLLTYNAKDNCCFEAGYALPPLVRAATPFYKLSGAEKSLRTHVNEVPGDHNYGQENREALYQMIGDFFFADDKEFSAKEIPCEKEVRKPEELAVPLPDDNLTINAVAKKLAADLPRGVDRPQDKAKAADWQTARRDRLAKLVRVPEYKPVVAVQRMDERGELHAEYRTLKAGPWTLPVVELTRGKPKGTAVVLCDKGRVAALPQVEELLAAGYRVLAVDIFPFGECHPESHDWLWGLMLATVGERPLGVQSAQLAAVARWATQGQKESVKVVAIGPRTSTVALVAAAVEPGAIAGLELHDPPGSLKEVIDLNRAVASAPELFSFGLLEFFDLIDIAVLVAPRPIALKAPSERAKTEFARLKDWYALLGKDFDPLK